MTKTLKVKSIGSDRWGRELFENIETKRIYALVDGKFYTTSKDGEPDSPLLNKVEIIETLFNNLDEEFKSFFSSLFEKYNIKVNPDLEYSLGLEHDYYKLLESVEAHIKEILEENDKLNKEAVYDDCVGYGVHKVN